MIDRLIIHIGPHKTGTTAIQRTLANNRATLAKCNISYPDDGFRLYGHHGIAEAIAGSTDWDLDTIFRRLNSLDGTVVLSSENFSLSPMEAVSQLQHGLQAHSVEIIFYQRNPLDLIFSLWNERVKHGNPKTLPIFYSEWLTRPLQTPALHTSRILESWGQCFKRTAIRGFLYDEIADVTRHFMKEILEIDKYSVTPDSYFPNKSLDLFTLEVIRCLNSFGIKGRQMILTGDTAINLLSKQISENHRQYLRDILVDFDCFVFKFLERNILERWGDRFKLDAGASIFFKKRASKIEYLDTDIWLKEDDLATELRRIIAGAPGLARRPA